ncbi:glycosyl hydrolase [Pedobacter changchengzhani]|uniref:Glycosyl hydrolase n=1 Tax=Pedobacter changchengzhani TaxID=2529274 RepID=A0A4V2ZZW2_9SPHI|nr:glycosyl hydrolase [Pedobacter changchengzhani]TDG35363.1 glycosyl hydrolase [Pedobacter changchengzhani]
MRNYLTLFCLLLLLFGVHDAVNAQNEKETKSQVAKAPLFRDPIYDGAADPMVIYNYKDKCWSMFYTNRRANVKTQGTNWVYGTDIGVATSIDHGKTWVYKGALNLAFEQGHNTFWAPHVVYDKGIYHMFVTYIPGISDNWSGIGKIAHYTSKDLWGWKFKQLIPLSEDALLDPTVYKKPDGSWGLWYKNSKLGYTVEAVSKDLKNWKNIAGTTVNDVQHEAPFVFKAKDFYWLLTDQWDGLGVYRSKDSDHWEKQGVILGKKGIRKDDNVRASHPGVVVAGDKIYVFYFTHPGWEKEGGWANEKDKLDEDGILPYHYRRSSIQVAEIKIENGILTCDRDAPFNFYLPDLNIDN